MAGSTQWQVVGKAKKTPAKKKTDDPGQSSRLVSDTSVSVDPAFAVLDREWQAAKKRAELSEAQATRQDDSGSDVDDDPAQPATDTPNKPPKKRRNPKPKKPKIADVATQITTDGSLATALDAIATKYAVDASARAEALAAYMQRTFEPCELAFNKLLLADPRRAAAEPLRQLHHDCAQPLCTMLQGVPLADAGGLAMSLLDAIVQGQPDTLQGGGTPPKAQVGLLLTMALLAQAHPAALLVASARIEQGGLKYASAGRAPLLMWTLDQFAGASVAACAAAYARIVLPQLLASPLHTPGPRLPTAAQTMLAGYFDSTLAPAAKALTASAPKGVGGPHNLLYPIIPTETFETLQRVVAASPRPLSALQKQLPLWRRVVAASAPLLDAPGLVRTTLDAAATAVASDGDDAPMVAAAAETLVACCAAHAPCLDAWVGRHKHALRGSAAVLTYLAAHPHTCVPLRARATAGRWTAALQALRSRSEQLATGKGWQGAAAARAEVACSTLLGGGSRGGGGGPVGVFVCLVLLLPVAAVLLRHDARVRGMAVHWLGAEVLPAADAAYDSAMRALLAHVQRVWEVLEPHARRLLVLAGPTIGWHA